MTRREFIDFFWPNAEFCNRLMTPTLRHPLIKESVRRSTALSECDHERRG